MRLIPKCELAEGRAGLKKTSFSCSLKDALVSLIKCSVCYRSGSVVLRKGGETAEAPDYPQSPELPASLAAWSTSPLEEEQRAQHKGFNLRRGL